MKSAKQMTNAELDAQFDGLYNLETARFSLLDEIVEKFPRKEIARYVLKTVRADAQELVNDLKELRDHLESVHEYYAERLLALDDQEDQA